MFMLGGVEVILVTVFFWVLSAWVIYMIVKAAVRNGILEADAARSRRAAFDRGTGAQAVAESKRRIPDQGDAG